MLDPKIKSKEIFFKELQKRFPDNHIEILDYIKASGPITYQCLDCGTIYKKSRANDLYENKTLCQKCFTGRTSILRQTFLEKLKENDFELLDTPTKAINETFHIRCKKCGREYNYKIQQTILENLDCRFCGKKRPIVDLENCKKRFQERGFDKEFEILKYKKWTASFVLKHKCGYVFSQLPSNFFKSGKCPKCQPKRSSGEQRIANYLEKNKIEFEEQKKFDKLGQLSYDFFIPSQNLLIEYQGMQHFSPIEHFGGEEKFKIQLAHDKKKRSFAEENNFQLLEISYLDFNNIEKILEGSTTIPKGSRVKRPEKESTQYG